MPAEKIVYLMRGLPSSGKSYTARNLAGKTGLVCETDDYFHTQVGDDPGRYDYRHDLLDRARQWNFERFQKAVDEGVTPIIVDRGNALTEDTRIYAQFALEKGYRLELKEPESEWWQELRVLLKYKQYTKPVLCRWANILARMSRATHRVPEDVILRRMQRWKFNLTVDDILQYRSSGHPSNGKAPVQSNTLSENDQIEKTPWLDDFVVELVDDASGRHPNNEIVVELSRLNNQREPIAKGKGKEITTREHKKA